MHTIYMERIALLTEGLNSKCLKILCLLLARLILNNWYSSHGANFTVHKCHRNYFSTCVSVRPTQLYFKCQLIFSLARKRINRTYIKKTTKIRQLKKDFLPCQTLNENISIIIFKNEVLANMLTTRHNTHNKQIVSEN